MKCVYGNTNTFFRGTPPPVNPPAYGFQVCVRGRSFALNTRFFFITHFLICHSFLDSRYREVFGTVLDFPLFEKEIEIYCGAQRVRQCIGRIEV